MLAMPETQELNDDSATQESKSDDDAVEIGKLYKKARQVSEDNIKAFIEAGSRLKEKLKPLKHGKRRKWLADNEEVLGFGWRTAARLQKAATKYVASDIFSEGEALEISRWMWGHSVRLIPSSSRRNADTIAAAQSSF
jgi:hypothetical protein